MSSIPVDNGALSLGRSLIGRLPKRHAELVRTAARRALRTRPSAPNSDLVVPDPSMVELAAADESSDHAICPMCGTEAEEFLPYGVKASRPDCQCPGCRSLERHRLVWLFFGLRTDLLTASGRSADNAGSTTGSESHRRLSFLHIAPERPTSNRLIQLPHLDYLSTDIAPGEAMEVMDITDIHRPDQSFDVIFASHVLEHIPDDVRAMSELRRVLRSDGWAVLQVPMHGERTREDPTVTDPTERERLFGQSDHVRMYGHDGEYERRLRKAGFDVEVIDLARELGPTAARRFRLRPGENVHLCRPAR